MEMTKYKLGDVLNFYNGRLRPNSKGPFPVFGGNGIIDYVAEYNYENNIIVGRVGANCGSVQKYDGKCWVSDNAISVTVKDGFSKDCVYYLLKLLDLNKKHVGAAQPLLTQEIISNLVVYLPKYDDQKKIASVLSALDDKIALNKKMNQKLEAMAKRLYDYWFVQYDFPDKNGHPYKTTGGPMTYNSTLKREIPVGWDVAPISEFIEKNFNGEWGKEEASEDDIRVHCVRGADIVDMVDMPVRYISTKKKDRILNPNDIIVEISGGSPTQSTGRATFVTRNTLNRFDSPMTCSNFCQIIRLKDAKCASYFFEMWQKFYASDIFFNFEGKTSGIKNFQTDSFIATPWAHPPKELMYKFDEMYQSFMKKKERLIAENQKLTTLRDKLLPLLMNGQVVVH
ncbi:restriction endonuclease subunit S [Fibrobacter sp. UWB11]|uniref:restriction endonuclease subunit S n=1 Tax=Fibrobacter sp. UWB11 TaxID=1896202 RepID=UPI000926FEEE|nr:restriction endonuclease subunit S [Fibrobacter sp. UWB11]SIO33349.1 type I restriction enzyme, S subunit [Fibrobacter sp. UWB11]